MDPIQQPAQAPETPEANPTPMPETNSAPVSPEVTSPAPVEAPSVASPQSVGTPAQPGIAPAAADPGKGLGIAGFVMSLLGFGVISLIMSIIAKNQSKKAGYSNGLALAGIIISAITMVLGVILLILVFVSASAAMKYCQENPTDQQCTVSSYESSYPQ